MGLCDSCEDGYALDKDRLCSRCPINCLKCITTDFCLMCVTGFRGERCHEQCINCKSGTPCDKTKGTCNTCNDGLSGLSCDTKCNHNCKSCNRLENDKCTLCSHDAYGEHCNYKCSSNCLESVCNNSDGSCTHGCSNGFWGNMCNYKCDALCQDSRCSRVDGHCTLVRKDKQQWLVIAISIVTAVLMLVVMFVVISLKRRLIKEYCVICQEKELSTQTNGGWLLQEDCQPLGAYYIDDFDQKRAYLVCREPETMDETAKFWELVWNERCNVIIKLSKFGECSSSIYLKYKKKVYGSILAEEVGFLYEMCFARRTIILQQNDVERKVQVYLLYPQFMESVSSARVLQLQKHIQLESSLSGPVLVNSSRDNMNICGQYMALDMFIKKHGNGQAKPFSDCVEFVRKQNHLLLKDDAELRIALDEVRYHRNTESDTENSCKKSSKL